MKQRYTQIDQEDNPRSPPTAPTEDHRTKYARIRKQIFTKIEALCWVIVAFIVFTQTDFLRNLLKNPEANQLFLKIYLVSVGASFSVIFFVSVVLPIQGYQNFEDYSPYILAVNNFFMIFAFLSCIVAVYPIYGLWSLLMVPVMVFGFLMITHFIPCKGNWNTFFLYLVFCGVLLYGYYFN